MILGRNLLTELGLNLKLSEHAIKYDDRPFKEYTPPMFNLVTYVLKYLNTQKITPEEQFTFANIEEVYDLEHVFTTTKLLRLIVDAKYKQEYLHQVMETLFQYLTMTQHNELLKLLQIFEDSFGGTFVTWKKYPVKFKLKGGVNPICLQPYPVPKVHEEM